MAVSSRQTAGKAGNFFSYLFIYLIILLLDSIQARLESAAGIDCGIPFGEVVDACPYVDVILGRIRRSTCEIKWKFMCEAE
jgi:hypothetical protein